MIRKPSVLGLIWIAASAVSLLIFLALAWISWEMFPDNDYCIYWSANQSLYCADTFASDAGALVLRRYSPWHAHVPLHLSPCTVEGGSDVPRFSDHDRSSARVRVWIDNAGQPVLAPWDRWPEDGPAAHWSDELRVTELLPLPISLTMLLAAILPAGSAAVLAHRAGRRWRLRDVRVAGPSLP